MGVEILKFGNKEIYLNISEKAVDKMIDTGVCTRVKMSAEFMLRELKKGYFLIPYFNGLKIQKIKTLKTKGECIAFGNYSVPLTTIRDICEYIVKGESVGDVKNKMIGKKTVVLFIKEFMDIPVGKKIRPIHGIIKSTYGDLLIKLLKRDGFIEIKEENTYEGEFIIAASPQSYYNDSTYNIIIYNDEVGIGCERFKTPLFKIIGKVLNQYLKDKKII